MTNKKTTKHTYILKATKLAVIQRGWVVVSRTPSVQMVKKMLTIFLTDVFH